MSKLKKHVQAKVEKAKSEGRDEALQAVKVVAQKQKPTIVHVEPKINVKDIAEAQLKTAQILEKHLSSLPTPVVDQEVVAQAIKGIKFDLKDVLGGLNSVAEAVSKVSAIEGSLKELQAIVRENNAHQERVINALEGLVEAQNNMVAAFTRKRRLKFTDEGATLEAS